MRKLIRFGALVGFLSLAASGALAANLVKDGGFETPIVPAGSYILFNVGQALGKWTVVGAPGNVAIVSGTFTQNGFTFPARSGAQWLDLTGNSNTMTGLSQIVATVAGSTYDLTFFVGNLVDPNGVFGTTSTVHVLVDGALLTTAVNSSGVGSTKVVWKKFVATVIATAATTTITFMNGDPSNDTMCGLDGVSMTLQSSAATVSGEPEPF